MPSEKFPAQEEQQRSSSNRKRSASNSNQGSSNTQTLPTLTLFLPLQYSWIAHQMDIGTSLGGRHNLVQFQIWGHFWIPRPKLHGACYLIFFRKTSKWPRLTSFCFSPQKNAFQGFFNLSFEPCLSSTRCESDTRDELTRTRVTSVNLHSNLNTFIEKFGARTKLSLVYASTLSSSSRGSALLP